LQLGVQFLDLVLQCVVLFLKGGIVLGATQSGSGVGLLAEEFRQSRFQVGDVLCLAADGGPQVQVVGFEAWRVAVVAVAAADGWSAAA
jgi:hypothetical protein